MVCCTTTQLMSLLPQLMLSLLVSVEKMKGFFVKSNENEGVFFVADASFTNFFSFSLLNFNPKINVDYFQALAMRLFISLTRKSDTTFFRGNSVGGKRPKYRMVESCFWWKVWFMENGKYIILFRPNQSIQSYVFQCPIGEQAPHTPMCFSYAFLYKGALPPGPPINFQESYLKMMFPPIKIPPIYFPRTEFPQKIVVPSLVELSWSNSWILSLVWLFVSCWLGLGVGF